MTAALACPAYLTGTAAEEWERALDELGPDVDGVVLASYCQAFGRWRAAEEILDKEGTEIVIRDDKGVVKNVIASPQVAIARAANAQVVKLWGRLSVRRRG